MWIRFLSDDMAYVPMQWAWMNPSLVLVSMAVSVVASVLALLLAGTARHGSHRLLKQTAGTFLLGAGVWAMHFIGMEAFTPCGSGSFSWLHSSLSSIPSLLAAGLVVHALSQPALQPGRVLRSGMVLGLGVALMHFMGMRASEATHYMDYAPTGLFLALSLGVALAMLAVMLYHRMQERGAGPASTALLSGSVMGLGTVCLHYLAMDAIHLPVGPDPTNSVPLESPWTLLTIGASLCLLLVLALLTLLTRHGRSAFKTCAAR